MHILVSILGLLGAGLFWWYRLRAAGAAVRDVADMAGRARGAVKRRRFRNRAASNWAIGTSRRYFSRSMTSSIGRSAGSLSPHSSSRSSLSR